MATVQIARPEVTTLKAAAERLGVSQGTIRGWIDKGQLAAVRTPGGTRRPLADDVERLYAEMYGVPQLQFDQPKDTFTPIE